MIEKHSIPIYECFLYICVTDDIEKSIGKLKDVFDLHEDPCSAVCLHNGGDCFGIFIDQAYCNMNTIAHEVFHTTHRILEWGNCNFDKCHHEQGAFLHGYLMDLVYSRLDKKNKIIKIKGK